MAGFEPLSGGPDGLQIIDPVLNNIAVMYRPSGFVYGDLVNSFPVEYVNGQYPIFNKAGFFASGDGRAIADDASTPIIDAEAEEGFYHCRNYRKRIRITREEYQQAHPALRIEQSKLMLLLDVFAGEREKRLAAKLRNTANGGQLTATRVKPTVKWDKGTSETPATIQADVQKAIQNVYLKTGIRPNTLVMTKIAAEAIAVDYTLKDQIKYQLGLQAIEKGVGILPATLFGLRTVIVEGALTNTEAAGVEPNLEEIWGKNALVLYIDPNPAWGKPTVCYGFRAPVTSKFGYSTPAVAEGGANGISQDEPDALSQFTIVDRWAEPDPPANNVRCWEKVDERVVAPELGCEIEGILT